MDSNALKESLILHCKITIKSLSQLLRTLPNDGVQELRRDEEVMAALSKIASLATSMTGIESRRLDDGADPVEDGSDRTRDEAAVLTLPPSARQDSASQGPAVGPPLPRTLVPRPPSPSMGLSSAGKPLHSILLHYPLMSMIGLPLSVAERDRIQRRDVEHVISTPLASRSYPRIRLLSSQVVVILHDDADELEELRTAFLHVQKSRWEQSNKIDLNFRFVCAWGKALTLLIFQHDYSQYSPIATKKTVEDIVGERKDVVGAVMARFPVLRQHQQLGPHDGPLAGGKMHQGAQILRTMHYGNGVSSSQSFQGPRLAVVVPITNGDFDFAQDFATYYSPFTYEGVDFVILAKKLQDPSDWLAEDGSGWDRTPETVKSYT